MSNGMFFLKEGVLLMIKYAFWYYVDPTFVIMNMFACNSSLFLTVSGTKFASVLTLQVQVVTAPSVRTPFEHH